MDLESPQNKPQKAPLKVDWQTDKFDIEEPPSEKGPLSSKKGAKSALKIQYEAEKKVIVDKIGDLESIRNELGLSKRKMAQLLMVDPSAWTRWTREEGNAPHSVYRSLQWYLALIEKEPAWHPANSFNRYNSMRGEKAISLENQVHLLQEKVKTLQNEAEEHLATFQRLRVSYFSLFIIMFIVLLAAAYFF